MAAICRWNKRGADQKPLYILSFLSLAVVKILLVAMRTITLRFDGLET